ncbi:MAG: hypothetical protein A2X48_01600 [Lentisphaerae bacterium GWF2_49_21]|nr:MAG: hypothetical protein A2X48_01600 [Lentisphaerae bacterium GWF2_49_21]
MSIKIKASFAAGISMAFLSLVGIDVSAGNPVPIVNGGFENGKNSWWGEGGFSIVTEGAAESKSCLKIAGGFACQDKIKVEGGKKYKISMKIKSEGAPEGSVFVQMSYRGEGVEIKWYGPAKANGEAALFSTGGTHGWKDFSVVVKSPKNVNQLLIYLRKIPGSAGVAYYDDIKAEETDGEVTGALKPAGGVPGKIVNNGNFESGKSPWWGEGDFAIPAEGSAEGKNCMKVTGGFACQDKMPVEEGKKYQISMKIKSEDAPERSVFVQISYRGEGCSPEWRGPERIKNEVALFVTGGKHDWKTFSAVVKAPNGADQLLVYLRKLPKTDGVAYYDDLKVEETDKEVTTAAGLRRDELAKEIMTQPVADEKQAEALKKIISEASSKTVKSVTLADAGKSACHIHVGYDEDLIELAVAVELAEYLRKISGADFKPLSNDKNPLAELPLIIVGRHNKLTEKLCPDIPYDKLGADGFVIRTVGSNIVIAGATPGGTMYGVNWFLDHKLGVKWLSPDYSYVPSSKKVEVSSLNEIQVPRFNFRQVLSAEGDRKPFGSHNLLNGNSHGAQGILSPPEIDHWDSSWQKPGLTASFYDLVPNRPGLRYGGQVAMMNPEVRQIIADGIIKRLKAVPEYQNYWFGLMDNDWGWDIDPASAAFAKEHGGVASAAKTDLAIDVLQRVRKVLPGAKIAFNAYHWGFSPPTGMKLPEGLLVYPMTIQLDYSTPLNKGRNEKLGKDIEGWSAVAEDILLWDHITNFNGYIQPTPNIYPICETIRWLATMPNIHGYFAEGSWNTKNAEFSSLRVWIIARMLWDPSTDYKEAIAKYCDAYYGPAGTYVKQYIDLMHESSAKTRAAIWEKTNIDSAMLSLDFVTKADDLMEKAQAAVASDPVLLKHVLEVRVNVDYVILVRRKEYQDEATSQKLQFNLDFANRLARFNQTLKDEGIKEYYQGGRVADLEKLIAIDRKDSTPPELVRGLPKSDWKEVQEIGFNRYYGNTIVVPDDVASDGAAARLDGKEGAPLIQLKHHKLPEEGLWDIYAEVRVDENGANPGDNALGIGTMPPQGNCTNIKLSQLKNGAYSLFKAPGGPFRFNQDDQAVSYIRGGNAKIKYIYADRFIFVRAPENAVRK